jgi:hypothetical protein
VPRNLAMLRKVCLSSTQAGYYTQRLLCEASATELHSTKTSWRQSCFR